MYGKSITYHLHTYYRNTIITSPTLWLHYVHLPSLILVRPRTIYYFFHDQSQVLQVVDSAPAQRCLWVWSPAQGHLWMWFPAQGYLWVWPPQKVGYPRSRGDIFAAD